MIFNRLKIFVLRRVYTFTAKHAWRKNTGPSVETSDVEIPVDDGHIALRLYKPISKQPLSVVVFYHGGGFVIGDIDTYDDMCRDLSHRTERIVVSVGYRLAPEHPFPCAPHDCMQALRWAYNHIEDFGGRKDMIYLAGDSAGGNLAAITALAAREKLPGLLKGQILIYPVTDHYDSATPSYRENATGQGLTRNIMIWFWDMYYRDSVLIKAGETKHSLATPLTVRDLSKLPPTLIITAEKDPLRDEGIAYADRLREQGVEVQHSFYKGLRHGFIGLAGPTKDHIDGINEIAQWMINHDRGDVRDDEGLPRTF